MGFLKDAAAYRKLLDYGFCDPIHLTHASNLIELLNYEGVEWVILGNMDRSLSSNENTLLKGEDPLEIPAYVVKNGEHIEISPISHRLYFELLRALLYLYTPKDSCFRLVKDGVRGIDVQGRLHWFADNTVRIEKITKE